MSVNLNHLECYFYCFNAFWEYNTCSIWYGHELPLANSHITLSFLYNAPRVDINLSRSLMVWILIYLLHTMHPLTFYISYMHLDHMYNTCMKSLNMHYNTNPHHALHISSSNINVGSHHQHVIFISSMNTWLYVHNEQS